MSRPWVLVVDDSDRLAVSLVRLLRGCGIRATAPALGEALEFLAGLPTIAEVPLPPAVLVTDRELGRPDLFEQLLERARALGVRVVVLTGAVDREETVGGVLYVSKAGPTERLVDLIRERL